MPAPSLAARLRILWAAVALSSLLPGAAQVLPVLLWQLSDSDCTTLSLELQKLQYCSVTTEQVAQQARV